METTGPTWTVTLPVDVSELGWSPKQETPQLTPITASSNSSSPAESGAVKLGVAVPAPVRITGVPLGWVQA